MSTWIGLHRVGNVIVLRKCPLLVEGSVTDADGCEDRERDWSLVYGLWLSQHGVQAGRDRFAPGDEVRAQFSDELFDDYHEEGSDDEDSVPRSKPDSRGHRNTYVRTSAMVNPVIAAQASRKLRTRNWKMRIIAMGMVVTNAMTMPGLMIKGVRG